MLRRILVEIFAAAILAVIFKLFGKGIFKLVENAVTGWIDDAIAKAFEIESPSIAKVTAFSVQWGLPLAAATAVLLLYHLAHSKWLPSHGAKGKVSDLAHIPPNRAMPLPPSADTWINLHDAYFLSFELRGLTKLTDPEGYRRGPIFDEFRQFASDGELAIRGRPSTHGRRLDRPMIFVPQLHWQEWSMPADAYIANDESTFMIKTEKGAGLLDSSIIPGRITYEGAVESPHDFPYYDLMLRRSDVERLFKTPR